MAEVILKSVYRFAKDTIITCVRIKLTILLETRKGFGSLPLNYNLINS